MRRTILMLAAAALLTLPAAAKSRQPKPPKTKIETTKTVTVPASARREFIKTHACPSTGKNSGDCPGYKVVYMVSPKKGGARTPANMEWRAVASGRAL
jgi:hypothetical protein